MSFAFSSLASSLLSRPLESRKVLIISPKHSNRQTVQSCLSAAAVVAAVAASSSAAAVVAAAEASSSAAVASAAGTLP